ncbi:type II toxin-antitoxin system HicA family toxin [uncultured Chitinophaga sp.]|uniref:type II toxin-antitoxin system HicA family toxin n=1 Tax=Chitinophaga sp. TaxID=1869181 RepID=UPI003458478E
MSRQEKLLARFLAVPVDFTWDELVSIMRLFGFMEIHKGHTGGSRRKFTDVSGRLVLFHKPHPGNVVKRYVLKDLIRFLISKGYIHE